MEPHKTVSYTVSLPPDLVSQLDRAIVGRYSSRSAAIQEAIRDLLVKVRRRSLPEK